MKFEDLRILQSAESLSDEIWTIARNWDGFTRDTVGKQLVRSVDSIGANIAEAYGRYHYGEKLKFLYYSRGSLFETRYWINRAAARSLLDINRTEELTGRLDNLGRMLNAFISSIKRNKFTSSGKIKESDDIYDTDDTEILFSPEAERHFPDSPITNN